MMGAVYAGEPVAFEAVRSIVLRREDERIDEVAVGMRLVGKELWELRTAMHRLVLLGVVRNDEQGSVFHFNPDDDWPLEASDKLIVLGHSSAVDHFKRKAQ
ncbi:MAG TPA: hypothetical protein ENL01_01875 [Chlorobaculum parvum]|uniref:RCK C-terminal domain-containing protein n=1 Tax=Chlorobaculum parvum TaxID=274539 RepID=A0A7C5HCK5_9CHLB|nr:hypothetical protein [Chlorobaculum parvum]